eukprot:gene3308-6550_t
MATVSVQSPMISLQLPSSSAAGIIAYLDESDDNLKIKALQRLYQTVDLHWAEICNSLPLIEEFSEDSSFPASELAAAVASKCFYHLQEYNDSLRLALSAGSYFNIYDKNEYVETLLSKCIDEYNELRKKQETDPTIVIDPRMENIVEQMFQRCFQDKCFEQAIGIALDTRRIDKVEEVCTVSISSGRESILGYTFNLCIGARNVTSREFRLAVISTLVKLYSTLADPDYSNVCFGLQFLNRPADVAAALDHLCKGTQEQALLACQICFDMQETENQGFILQVVAAFPALQSLNSDTAANPSETSTPTSIETESKESNENISNENIINNEIYKQRLHKLNQILTEGFDVDLYLNFLFHQSHTDISILRSIKLATEGRTAILHHSTVVTHAYMNSGTTLDTFLRENLEWLGKANNWAKFTAVASIGVVHKGHVHESMNLLQPYLPRGGMSSSPYSESGALYALGLIHFNKGGSGDSVTISYLSEALRNAGTNEVVQHGACLGIGLAAMATGNEVLFDELKGTLFTDSAVAGEGAALAIGMLLLGLSDSNIAQGAIADLLNYAHDTSHEKIIRALALAIAFMVYGKEESADGLIEQLARDRDPIIRYGAMYAVAMAYCGTGDNSAVRRLLHVAVSDVNDDVRRAAVSCLGFVMFRTPEVVPRLVSLLAESFNPHVRYGACMAIGLACAGSGLKDAIDLLQPMLDDQVDFVRQGAYMSLALVIMQISEAKNPIVKKFREQIVSVIADKHQPPMAKCGAILAAGILDAGGRNVVVSMQSRGGFMKMGSVIGLALWLQYWYWYPLMLFLTLSFSPTALIGLNKDFDMPHSFTVKCNAQESMFAYPKVEEKKEDKKEKVVTAVLSTTAKARAREAKKEAKRQGGKHGSGSGSGTTTSGAGSDGNVLPPDSPLPQEKEFTRHSSVDSIGISTIHEDGSGADKMEVDTETSHVTATTATSTKREREPQSYMLANPTRVIPTQVRFVTVPSSQRYVPVGKSRPTSGIVMLMDTDPTAPEDVTKVERVALGQEEEAEPPQPFEWTPERL